MKTGIRLLFAFIVVSTFCSAQNHVITNTILDGSAISASGSTSGQFQFYVFASSTRTKPNTVDQTWLNINLCVYEAPGTTGAIVTRCYSASGTVPQVVLRGSTDKLTLDVDLASFSDTLIKSAERCTETYDPYYTRDCTPITPVNWQVHVETKADGLTEYDNRGAFTSKQNWPGGLRYLYRNTGDSTSRSGVATGTVMGIDLSTFATSIPGNLQDNHQVTHVVETWRE